MLQHHKLNFAPFHSCNFCFREQEARDERAKVLREGGVPVDDLSSFDASSYGMNAGCFDDGDPNTTNLYVGNIAPDVDEGMLMKEFGRCVHCVSTRPHHGSPGCCSVKFGDRREMMGIS